MAKGPIGEAYNHLQFAVQDEVDVHRVVLAWRAWDSLDLTGHEHAHTLLRQSVRYCVDSEKRWMERNMAEYKARVEIPITFGTCCRSCSISTGCSRSRSALGGPKTAGSSR